MRDSRPEVLELGSWKPAVCEGKDLLALKRVSENG